MEEECHLLDLELATQTAPQATDRQMFVQYSTLVKELGQLENKRNELRQYTDTLQQALTTLAIQLPNPETHPQFQALRQEARSANGELKDAVGFSMSSSYDLFGTCV